MKIIKIIGLVLLAVVVLAAVGLVLFLKNFDLNQYKPQIIAQAQNALQRKVAIGNLGLALSWQGVSARVDNLVISDDPGFSAGDFLNVGQIALDVDVPALILQKKIVLRKVEIRSLAVTMIRAKDGKINIPVPAGGAGGDTPAETDKAGKAAAAQPPAGTGSPATTSYPGGPAFGLEVKSIRVIGGQVRFIDRMQSPELSAAVGKIGLEVRDFSLADKFSFICNLAFLSEDPNIQTSGQVQLDLAKAQVKVFNAKANLDLRNFSLGELFKLAPQLRDAGLERLAGRVQVVLAGLTADSAGLRELNSTVSLEQGMAAVKSLAVPLTDMSFKLTATEKKLNLERFFIRIGSGDVRLDAGVDDYLQDRKYNFSVSAKNILLQEILPPLPQGVKAEGAAGLELKGSGSYGAGADPLAGLNAEGDFGIEGMKLTNLKVLKQLLDKITLIPGFYTKVYEALSDEARAKLEQDYVAFSKVRGDINGQAGVLNLTGLEVAADLFELEAQGAVDSQMNLSYTATVFIPADISKGIAAGAREISGLIDNNGRMEIPLMPFKGKLNEFQVIPDLGVIGKKIAVSEGKKHLGDLLDKALGVEPKSEAEPGEEGEATEETSPGQQIIEGVLGTIFNK